MADIFVSYRRDDSQWSAGRINDNLAAVFGAGRVFFDTVTIKPGEDFHQVLGDRVGSCRVLLAVIGPRWLDILEARLGEPNDFVRIEIAQGLARNVRVIPVLIDGAKPPPAARLPDDIRALARLNAIPVRADTFRSDLDRLIGFLREYLDGPPAGTTPPRVSHVENRSDLSLLAEIERFLARTGATPTKFGLAAVNDGHLVANLRKGHSLTSKAADKVRAYLAHQSATNSQQGTAPPEGRINVDAKIVHGAPDGWFKPGAGKDEWFKDLDVGPEMVVVPAGEFMMGSNDYDDEGPPHKVAIKAPFAVGRFAVTFAEWDAASLAHEPEDEGWGRGRRPVINVSWDDAKAYVGWLSQRTGKEYRLLSEAEWEYCCRAGTTTKYAFGDSITASQAQFSEGSAGSAGRTAEVGKFAPNAWGLYDTHGNVREWCPDSWHHNYVGAPQDGSVWASDDASLRVLRGGSWYVSNPRFLHSAYRAGKLSGERNNGVGFRVARTL